MTNTGAGWGRNIFIIVYISHMLASLLQTTYHIIIFDDRSLQSSKTYKISMNQCLNIWLLFCYTQIQICSILFHLLSTTRLTVRIWCLLRVFRAEASSLSTLHKMLSWNWSNFYQSIYFPIFCCLTLQYYTLLLRVWLLYGLFWSWSLPTHYHQFVFIPPRSQHTVSPTNWLIYTVFLW